MVFIQCVPKCPSLQILHRITVGVNDITDTPVALNGPRFFEPQLGKALAVAGVCGRVFFRTYADRIFYGFGYLDGSVFRCGSHSVRVNRIVHVSAVSEHQYIAFLHSSFHPEIYLLILIIPNRGYIRYARRLCIVEGKAVCIISNIIFAV